MHLSIASIVRGVVPILALGLSSGLVSACSVVNTHSSANFAGGQFIVQAGFAQGEAAAASFTLPASAFPLKLNLAEMVFATSNASVLTTTVWDVFVYDGTPDTGELIFSEVADDVVLPFLRLGPGTAGSNIQFSIDPQDPEQIIINNTSGTGTFTVGFGITQHSDPPANPCLQSPNTATNAFPTTDTNGLSQPSRNWLYAIDCGIFGAPPGWHSFNQLATVFRPTGDWNIRVTYESLNEVQITDQPDSINTTIGQPAIFSVVAEGAGPFTYQWLKNNQPISNGPRVFGATSESLVIFPTVADDAADYRVQVTSPCGALVSDIATLSFGTPQSNLSGTITLADFVGSVPGRSVAVDVVPAGGTVATFSGFATLGVGGTYTVNMGSSVPAGNYDVYLKGSHWLRKKLAGLAFTATGRSGVNATLLNGDADGDNEVGGGDLSALSSAFLTADGDAGYSDAADLDGDGEVGSSDLSILSASFLLSGD